VNAVDLAVLWQDDLEIAFVRPKKFGRLGTGFGQTVCNELIRFPARVVHFFSLFSPQGGVQLAG